MALRILRNVVKGIHNSVYYTVMADETTDKSNREQVVFVIRHVSEDLVPHEKFIGMYKVPAIDANALAKTIEDCLVKLALNTCRGRCYNGASIYMSGSKKKGVATQNAEQKSRAICNHCYGQTLNLVVGDSSTVQDHALCIGYYARNIKAI